MWILGLAQAFRGHAGKAALFTETRNVSLDPPSILLMDSGAYTIAEFICASCEAYLGWKFVRAHDGPERWKEGHFILELDLVVEEDDPGADTLALAVGSGESPLGLHKRAMSADPRPPKGARQGYRSLQAGPKQMGVQPQNPGPRRLETDGPDAGPFWKPR
ncbi:hypothetical protein C8Q76DRAFT_632331 [Earliella scabrosa]|nr:hypothetical protein C8Q76DRAFT_632331 [Earliella scabrosa]